MTLSGSAAVATTSDGSVLRLTPATANLSGSAFGTQLIRVQDFSSSFSFRMTESAGISDCNGHVGADGFTFTAQPVSHSIGSNGGGLGVEGVTPALSVEFDTFCNAGTVMDPSSNHIGIDLDGVLHSVTTADVTPFMNDGKRWYVWIDYDGTTLSVRLGETATRPATAQLTYPVDLKSVLGTDTAYVGFTAATGGGYQNHDILQWTYYDHYVPPPGGDGGSAGGGSTGQPGAAGMRGGAGAGGAGGTVPAAGTGGAAGHAGSATGDAGAAGQAAGGRAGDGPGGGSGGAVPPGAKGDSGCACSVGHGESRALVLVVLAAAAALIAGRRRRRE